MKAPNPYRGLPAVDALAHRIRTRHSFHMCGDGILVDAARHAITQARLAIAGGAETPTLDSLEGPAVRWLAERVMPSLRPVINATGVIVHTNLGRAPLTTEAIAAALGACTLEYDLASGGRGSRGGGVETLLTQLSGAQAALVVNNNAAAVVLMLAGLCAGREVLISRGELVEIGGSFRVPEIMEASGTRLVEVGTTNKTYARDYVAAATPETAAILRVHPSNYRIEGFSHRPSVASLAEAARTIGVPLLDDLGSGTFFDLPSALSGGDGIVASMHSGTTVLCFSGDKLLGGPQAGILLGDREAITKLRKHPLARAMRLSKLSLAALEYTLQAYRLDRARSIPVVEMLHIEDAVLAERAQALAAALRADAPEGVTISVIAVSDAVGGGSRPGETLPGWGVAISSTRGGTTALSSALRRRPPHVITTLSEGRVVLHMRTVLTADIATLEAAVKRSMPNH
ncbi:MAG: L-seryl-tRNA(Ser) seleniumtransferase [Myxococcota bacterium]|jgi:L-seryl-tRNA(Ser) seleniumtransferase